MYGFIDYARMLRVSHISQLVGLAMVARLSFGGHSSETGMI
jgi:hypothetical protein